MSSEGSSDRGGGISFPYASYWDQGQAGYHYWATSCPNSPMFFTVVVTEMD